MRRLKRLLTLAFVVLAALYLFLVLNVNVLFVPSDELEPSLSANQIVLISRETVAEPGDVVAIESHERVLLRRVFTHGPTAVSCFKGIGFENGQMKRFVQVGEIGDDGQNEGVITEQWGTHSILIKRDMKLVPVRSGVKGRVLTIPADELLVGCQNRIRCNGCGFMSVPRASIVGRVRNQDDDHVFRWLTAIVAYFR